MLHSPPTPVLPVTPNVHHSVTPSHRTRAHVVRLVYSPTTFLAVHIPTTVSRIARMPFIVAALYLAAASAAAQTPTTASVHVTVHSEQGAPLTNVIVSAGATAARTTELGDAHLTLPAGAALIHARRIGYAPDSVRVVLRAGLDTTIALVLRAQASAIAPVVVSATRAERRVEDEPLRVEVLAGEDVGEKTQMRPADLRVLLTEMSGVRVQTTSPSLGAAALRIQGLRGRYTQILTDGLPLYGAQAGSFGLLQIPPLDLRQAEVIKGAASALYGPGALGGVLDLVSRRPPDSSEMLLNGVARGGADYVAFGARQLSASLGLTVLGGLHAQRMADVDGDGWSDIPGLQRVELRPRLFVDDSSGHTLMVTAGAFAERRGGGAPAPRASGPGPLSAFPESLTTRHVDAGAVGRAQLTPALSATARVAANTQQRMRVFGAQNEDERSSTLFAEGSASATRGPHFVLAGAAVQHERYRNADVYRFDFERTTPALFAQHTFTPVPWLSTQLNGRCDFSDTFGTICTPRASLLAHDGRLLSARLSAGAGWSAPTPLIEETEVIGLSRVAALGALLPERSQTLSLDLGASRGPVEVSGTLFASRVHDPVGLRAIPGDPAQRVQLVNARGDATSHGAELFGVYNAEPVVATAYYAATRTREVSPETGLTRESPGVPRETAGIDVALEDDESGLRAGVEAFYTGPQALEGNPYLAVAPAFTTVGVLVSARLGRATVYLNVDNLTDVRQTRNAPLLRPTPGDGGRWTIDQFAPREGRSVNAGVRWPL